MAEPSLPKLYSGKVRDIYDAGDDRLLMVTSDRLSAFDVVLDEPIPDKGRVLTAMSAFWFERFADLIPGHLIATDLAEMADLGIAADDPDLAGRVMLCRKAEMLPVECIVRGYITGSAWKEYKASGTMNGRALPAGILESAQLPEPVFTPSTKAEVGDHDDQHQLRGGGRPDRHRAGRAGPRRVAADLPGGRRLGRRARASSWPTPSSSSACSTAS